MRQQQTEREYADIAPLLAIDDEDDEVLDKADEAIAKNDVGAGNDFDLEEEEDTDEVDEDADEDDDADEDADEDDEDERVR